MSVDRRQFLTTMVLTGVAGAAARRGVVTLLIRSDHEENAKNI